MGKMELLSVEDLHLVLIPAEWGVWLTELGSEHSLLCPLQHLQVFKILYKLFRELNGGQEKYMLKYM